MAKKALMRRPAEDRRVLIELTRQALAEHKGDNEILEILASYEVDDVRELSTLKRMVRQEEQQEVEGRSAMDTYLDFRRDMLDVVRKLDEFVTKLSGAEAHQSSIPTALRAKADVLDKVLTRGQDLGVVVRKGAGAGVLIGGILVGSMSDSEIMEKLAGLQDGFRVLVNRVSTPMLPGGFRYTKTPEELGEGGDDEEDNVIDVEPKKRDKRKRPVRRRPS